MEQVSENKTNPLQFIDWSECHKRTAIRSDWKLLLKGSYWLVDCWL